MGICAQHADTRTHTLKQAQSHTNARTHTPTRTRNARTQVHAHGEVRASPDRNGGSIQRRRAPGEGGFSLRRSGWCACSTRSGCGSACPRPSFSNIDGLSALVCSERRESQQTSLIRCHSAATGCRNRPCPTLPYPTLSLPWSGLAGGGVRAGAARDVHRAHDRRSACESAEPRSALACAAIRPLLPRLRSGPHAVPRLGQRRGGGSDFATQAVETKQNAKLHARAKPFHDVVRERARVLWLHKA